MIDEIKILNFFADAEKLKTTLRFGANELIPRKYRESSADHSWKVSLLVFVLAKELNLDIDLGRAIKMAIIHDLAEAISGDVDHRLIATGKITPEYKKKIEKEAIKKIMKNLSKNTKNEFVDLLNEYEERKTEESKYVKAVDVLETTHYLIGKGAKYYDNPDLIAAYPDEHIKRFPELLPILKIVKTELKKEFAQANIPWKKEYNFGL